MCHCVQNDAELTRTKSPTYSKTRWLPKPHVATTVNNDLLFFKKFRSIFIFFKRNFYRFERKTGEIYSFSQSPNVTTYYTCSAVCEKCRALLIICVTVCSLSVCFDVYYVCTFWKNNETLNAPIPKNDEYKYVLFALVLSFSLEPCIVTHQLSFCKVVLVVCIPLAFFPRVIVFYLLVIYLRVYVVRT